MVKSAPEAYSSGILGLVVVQDHRGDLDIHPGALHGGRNCLGHRIETFRVLRDAEPAFDHRNFDGLSLWRASAVGSGALVGSSALALGGRGGLAGAWAAGAAGAQAAQRDPASAQLSTFNISRRVNLFHFFSPYIDQTKHREKLNDRAWILSISYLIQQTGRKR